MAAPRVTIGLPVYNGERYLAAAIDSLLAQDYGDFELLIADNASTDGSLGIAETAAARDSRVAVVRSDVNRGAAWNYNRLVDLACGEYFKWAAHDDLLRPAFLRRCVDELDARPEVVLAYTRAVGVDELGNEVRTYARRSYAASDRPSVRAASILLDPSPCLESFGLIRTADLRRTGRIGAYTSSDRTLFLELSLIGRFSEVQDVLFLHRVHEERSVRRYADDRARNLWFDPAWAGRRSAPKWRLLREYATSVTRSSIGSREKARTSILLLRWLLLNRGTLARELASHLTRRSIASSVAVPTVVER